MKITNIFNKYKISVLNSLVLSTIYVIENKTKIFCLKNIDENKSNVIITNNEENKKEEVKKNSKIPYKEKIKEFRAAALFEDYTDLFEFSDIVLNKEELEDAVITGEDKYQNIKKKIYEEYWITIGDENTIKDRNFIQIDLYKMNHPEEKDNEIDDIDAPEKYFKKF